MESGPRRLFVCDLNHSVNLNTGHTRGKGPGKNTADENLTRSNQHRTLRIEGFCEIQIQSIILERQSEVKAHQRSCIFVRFGALLICRESASGNSLASRNVKRDKN